MPPSFVRPAPPRRRLRARVPAALLGVLAAGIALAGCAPGEQSPGDTASSGSPAPSTSPIESAAPSGTPTVDARTAMAGDLADAIASGNTAAIEGYLADPTRVVIAASEADGPYAPVDAVIALDYVQPGVGVWDFALDPQILDVYRANPYYGQFFPCDVIAGRSSEGPVVAFVPAGGGIGTIFMSIDETLITES